MTRLTNLDASLDALLADALTSDYHAPTGHKSRSTIGMTATAITGVILAFTLALAVTQTRSNQSESALTRQALIDRVQIADHRVEALEGVVAQAQIDLETAEQAVLAGNSLGALAQKRLAQVRAAAGFSDVTGSAIDLMIDDAPIDPTAPADANLPGKVQDRDLQFVVNGLWQSGATAITINDRRLTGTSAIRAAGEAILVDYRPLKPPYRIVAIAPDADALAGLFRENSAGLLLEELQARYGVIWDLGTLREVTLKAATSNTSTGAQ